MFGLDGLTLFYLKNASWRSYTPNYGASWYWKKICHVKVQIKQIYSQDEFNSLEIYSIKAVYEKLTREQQHLSWDRMVWNRLIVPKRRFILWLTIKSKLQTTTRLYQHGVSQIEFV